MSAPRAGERRGWRGRRLRFPSGEDDRVGPIDRLIRVSPSTFRRRLIAGAGIAIVLLATLSTILAVRQYDGNRHRALSDLNARVLLVGGVVNTYFQGDVALLESIAASPTVVSGEPAAIEPYLARVHKAGGASFSGDIAWIDASGHVRASSTAGSAATSVVDRDYFKRVMTTGKPYISAGIVGRRTRKPVVVVAVPTSAANGHRSGVLIG